MKFRVGESRAQRLHDDLRLEPFQLQVQSLREGVHPAFGGAVADVFRPAHESGHRGDIDDGPGISPDHTGQHCVESRRVAPTCRRCMSDCSSRGRSQNRPLVPKPALFTSMSGARPPPDGWLRVPDLLFRTGLPPSPPLESNARAPARRPATQAGRGGAHQQQVMPASGEFAGEHRAYAARRARDCSQRSAHVYNVSFIPIEVCTMTPRKTIGTPVAAALFAMAFANFAGAQRTGYNQALWSGMHYRMIGPERGGRVTAVDRRTLAAAYFLHGLDRRRRLEDHRRRTHLGQHFRRPDSRGFDGRHRGGALQSLRDLRRHRVVQDPQQCLDRPRHL